MAPVHAIITKASRVSVGLLITLCLLVVGGLGFAYQTRQDLKSEIGEVRTTNAVQDQNIDRTRDDVIEIKADVKELLRRLPNATPPSKP